MKTKFIFVFIIFHFPLITLAYSPYNTHQVLTEEIVNFYNLLTEGRKISPQELEWMKKGTADEDYPPRWLHHFYNPLTKKGWTGKRLGLLSPQQAFKILKDLGLMAFEPVSSLVWAQDHLRQAQESEIWTFNVALANYGQGNYQKAFEALGHILHLLQDLTVPEHVRDDAHPDIGLVGEFLLKDFKDSSPYEKWAKDYTLSHYNEINLAKDLFAKGEKFYQINSLEEAFHNLALFVFQNFFSPQTIFDEEFSEPNKEIIQPRGEFLYNTILNVKVAAISKENNYVIDNNVAEDIWRTVTPELLKYGAGLLDYFFKEAERTKQDSDILKFYLQRTSLSQMEYSLYSWYVYQTSFLTQTIRVLNFLDKVSADIKVSYYQTKNKVLLSSKNKSEQFLTEANEKDQNSNLVFEQKLETNLTDQFQNLTPPLNDLNQNDQLATEDKNTILSNNISSNNINLDKDQQNEKSKDLQLAERKLFQKTNEIPILKPTTSTLNLIKTPTTSSNYQDNFSKQSSTQTPTNQSLVFRSTWSSEPPKDECQDLPLTFPKIIINALKFEGENSKDEFIELYNPNNFEVDLKCWSLMKKTAGTSTDKFFPLVSKKSFQGKIQPYSFFLISHPSSTTAYLSDLTYPSSYSFSKNNVIALFNPQGEIVDLVGFGDDPNKIKEAEKEPFIFTEIPPQTFLERKNFQDTDNNRQDFWLVKRTPYNSSTVKKPLKAIYNLSDFPLSFFEVIPQQKQIYITLQDPLIPQDHQPLKALLKFSTSIPSYFLDLNFDGQEKTFILPICPSAGTFKVELIIYDENNEFNFISTSSQFEITNDFCSLSVTNKILISEVLIETSSSSADEFIELYNPNNFTLDLSKYKIVKKTKSGTQITLLSSKTNPPFQGILKPYSYFLITNSSSSYASLADIVYPYSSSKSLAKDNSLLILDENDNVVDLLGWGNAFAYETQTTSNPLANMSLERKVSVNSTSDSLRSTESSFGNFYDSNNNLVDFVLQPNPLPQNSSIQKLPPTLPSNFQIKTYFSDLNLEGKYLSWYEKAKPQNQIIKFSFNDPLVNEYPEAKYLISYIFASGSKQYLNFGDIFVGQDQNLREIEFNVCHLTSGPYEFFLEIQTSTLKENIIVASTTFFKDPFLYPCPPKAPEVKIEKVNLDFAPSYSSGNFLKLFYYDPPDTDFLATPFNWQNIPQNKSFFIIKIATSSEALSDDNFFRAKDLWGINYWWSDSPSNPLNNSFQPGEHLTYIDLFDFEKGQTYWLGIKAFSVYDFLFYDSFLSSVPQPCHIANFRTRFHDNLISSTNLNCYFTHFIAASTPKFNDEALQFSLWSQSNFYDSQNHQYSIPFYSTDLGNIQLEKEIQNYPFLLSSTTLISFTVDDNKTQRISKYFKKARFFEEDGKLYFEFSPFTKLTTRYFIFRIISLKNNDLTPITVGETSFNLVFPAIWVEVKTEKEGYSWYFDAEYLPEETYRILVLDNSNYTFDENDMFEVAIGNDSFGNYDLIHFKFGRNYEFYHD